LTDVDAVRAMGSSLGRVDAALYLAANGDPVVSAERPAWDLESNTLALVLCLEHCRVDHVVFVSSGAVYDGLVGDVAPGSALAPRLPYAISKLASEHYLSFFVDRRRSVGSAIAVRFFGAYGPHEPERKITTRWMRAAMLGQREFTVRGDGENLIDFMYVDDAVEGFVKLTESMGVSTTVDFASGSPVTVNEVVRTMARTLGVDVTVSHQGHTDEYIQFRSIDTSMRKRFGIVPRTSFADGMMRLRTFLNDVNLASDRGRR
jgi:UDP-glucose 4-epimerase